MVGRSVARLLAMTPTLISTSMPRILSRRFGHENIFTAMLPLPLIQEELLSGFGRKNTLFTGKLCPRGSPRNNERITDHPNKPNQCRLI